ncbi:hypothetical protein PYCCODRAFT_506392 [Trametes coccinea BRFM310]|uniref:Uncharacterized protein n=1 Tax=Trametes coccinea (strain BRFM310) TaxID=1353009 RepID=A0A1Y2IJV1_TRAC3|nr:hypothetical protein PYCCODRAFT_506392 [Trametes coccinea BRFM310]
MVTPCYMCTRWTDGGGQSALAYHGASIWSWGLVGSGVRSKGRIWTDIDTADSRDSRIREGEKGQRRGRRGGWCMAHGVWETGNGPDLELAGDAGTSPRAGEYESVVAAAQCASTKYRYVRWVVWMGARRGEAVGSVSTRPCTRTRLPGGRGGGVYITAERDAAPLTEQRRRRRVYKSYTSCLTSGPASSASLRMPARPCNRLIVRGLEVQHRRRDAPETGRRV